MQFVQRWSLALWIGLTLLLSGCGSAGAGEIFRYDVSTSVANLDPQYATDETARMIILSSFDGLLRQMPDGSLAPSVAESYQISEDGLTYTFLLRKDEVWSNGSKADSEIPLTAHDFVFAFRRMFDPKVPSPFASTFLSLKNAPEALRGAVASDQLGIHAPDDYTLVFSLSRPDSRLPELLAGSAAMPCNEAFFRSTRARYGLDVKNLRFNGAFYVRNWDHEKGYISLRANRRYARQDSVTAGGIDLTLPKAQKTSPENRFFAGETDACRVSFQTAQALQQEGSETVSFEDTVWVLAMNLKQPQLASSELRAAIAHTINRSELSERLPQNLRSTAVFIPPAIGSIEKPFRTYAGEGTPIGFSQDLAKRSYQAATAELGGDAFSALTEILVCAEDPQPLLAGYVQKYLHSLSISTGLVRLPREELLRRVNTGDYALAILPLSAAYSSPNALFSLFRSDNTANFTGYQNPTFDRLLDQTSTASGDQLNRIFSEAEQLLLSDCPIVPLYFETTSYAMAKGVSGIRFSPFLSGTDFRDARKK